MSASNGTIHVRVRYPLQKGRMVLRADADWESNLEAEEVSDDRQTFRFEIRTANPFAYFKPIILQDGQIHWSKGENYLALADQTSAREVHPFFFEEHRCSVCNLREVDSARLGRKCQYRVFYPPGYHENPLQRYPVLYLQDGQNLFFQNEAAYGNHWKVEETLSLLTGMNAVANVIAVGVYPSQREEEYTLPGYRDYGAFLVDELKPLVDAEFRTLPGPETTAVMGSSLGGVVSFHLTWERPDVFGMAACLSSTFGWKDDLRERVAGEPKRAHRLYLDSGWPRDNYEATRNMRTLLVASGYREGTDLMYLAFPEARHDEASWATRSHIPYQFFFGRGGGGFAQRRDFRLEAGGWRLESEPGDPNS